eukprot:5211331-Amphidinium_carterae.1
MMREHWTYSPHAKQGPLEVFGCGPTWMLVCRKPSKLNCQPASPLRGWIARSNSLLHLLGAHGTATVASSRWASCAVHQAPSV